MYKLQLSYYVKAHVISRKPLLLQFDESIIKQHTWTGSNRHEEIKPII